MAPKRKKNEPKPETGAEAIEPMLPPASTTLEITADDAQAEGRPVKRKKARTKAPVLDESKAAIEEPGAVIEQTVEREPKAKPEAEVKIEDEPGPEAEAIAGHEIEPGPGAEAAPQSEAEPDGEPEFTPATRPAPSSSACKRYWPLPGWPAGAALKK